MIRSSQAGADGPFSPVTPRVPGAFADAASEAVAGVALRTPPPPAGRRRRGGEASPPEGMNALADAAFLSAAEGPGPYGSTAYTDAELQAMGAVGMPMQAGVMGPPMAMPGRGMVPQHLPGPGRHLQIMDHTVHRIDTNIKANGEEEKEMVVSNLRHFTLKIGVIDRSGGGHEAELPLKAELLYENGARRTRTCSSV